MSRKLYDQFKSDKSSLPHADNHLQVKKDEGDSTLKSYRKHHNHKQGNYEREYEDELVKYMSNLPGYLQTGRENREKALNVGVLDWSRLEQWQYSHKQELHRNSRSSSSSNASSSVSTDRLSGPCSKGQRTFHPSLQSHFMAFPSQDHSEAIKHSRRSVGNCQDLRGGRSNVNTLRKHVTGADDHLSQNHPNGRLKGCDRKYSDPCIDEESGIFLKDQMHKAVSCAKLEMHIKDGGMVKMVDTLNEPNISNVVRGMFRKDGPQNCHGRVPHMQTSLPDKSENYSRLSFSEEPKEFYHKDLKYDNLHSHHTHPDGNDSQRKGSGCSSTDLESFRLPASTISSPLSTLSSPFSVRMGISPSKFRQAEERKQTMGKTSSANGPLHDLDQKVTSEKSRSSSPYRRLSISIGRTNRGSACKEAGLVPRRSSITTAKSSSENVRGCDSSNISDNDIAGDANRSRSSPLRRLLDPLLKPKTTKFSQSLESSQKDSLLINKNCRSAVRFSTLQPRKEADEDHRADCIPVNTIDSSRDKKPIPSMTRALLRIAVRNGLPLFTFAADHDDSNIIAAKVKNLVASGKDEFNRIYTIFTFNEVKKNGSWMNKAGRKKGPDYSPHVAAQMTVSDSHYYDLTNQNCVDSSIMKEFVLFSVKLGQGDAQDTDYQPNNELAAIVVKIPKAISFINDQHQSSCLIDNHDLVHATVVLPSGVHSLPSNGGPSSLLVRWKSGGSCDCGGWDLACNLKILASKNQSCRKPRSSKAYCADQLDLYVEGIEQDIRPAFSLTPFEHGMCSISFDSSLSLLQAFAICIASVDSKTPCELSGSRNSLEGKNPRETLLMPTEELKSFGKLEDIPTSYVSYPPLSPVSRV